MQNLIKLYQRVQIPQPAEMMLVKSRHHFAHEWSDNLKMYKLVNIDQTMPCTVKVMNIFSKKTRLAKVMLCEAISSFCIPVLT